MRKKRALITGVTGQDGSYLGELLLDKGYDVIGMVRRTSTLNFQRIRHVQDRLTLVQGDLLDQSSLVSIMREYHPEEVYNLAAQSFVPTSWAPPVLPGDFTGLAVARVLEALRLGRTVAHRLQQDQVRPLQTEGAQVGRARQGVARNQGVGEGVLPLADHVPRDQLVDRLRDAHAVSFASKRVRLPGAWAMVRSIQRLASAIESQTREPKRWV